MNWHPLFVKYKEKIIITLLVIFMLLFLGSCVNSCREKKAMKKMHETEIKAAISTVKAKHSIELAKKDSIASAKHTKLAQESKKSFDSLMELLNKRKPPVKLNLKPHEQQKFWDTTIFYIRPVRWEN